MAKNLSSMQETWEMWVQSLVGKTPWRREWQPNLVFVHKESHEEKEPGRLQSMGWQRVRHD